MANISEPNPITGLKCAVSTTYHISFVDFFESHIVGTEFIEFPSLQVTDFFSYEHFYVIYCKFWELDKDHDLFIDREDLARHNDHGKKPTL